MYINSPDKIPKNKSKMWGILKRRQLAPFCCCCGGKDPNRKGGTAGLFIPHWGHGIGPQFKVDWICHYKHI
jgi:hypothetical protein